MRLAEAYVEIRIDRKKAEADARSAAQSAHDAMKSIFKGALVIEGLKQSIGQASDLNETISKTGVIFGDSSKDITAWSQNSAKQLGLSQRAALDAASTFATFGKSAGLAGTDLTGFATNLTGLSSDLASFYNSSPEEAINAIGAALRGESEPIRQFGVLLDDATLKQRAMALGIYDGNGALTQQQRVLAAQAEIIAQTSDAQGDFARTADGVANSQRIAAAEAENSAASFGQVLLPVYDKALEVVTFLVDKFGDLPPVLQTAVVGLAGVAAFSGPLGKVKDAALDFSKALTKIGVSAKAQEGVLAGFALVMVGLAIRQKQIADRNAEITRSIEDLSRAADGDVLNAFFDAFSEGLFKTKSAGAALDEIVQTNIEGARRALELGRATGQNVEVFDMLAEAIKREEAAQAEAAATAAKYGAETETLWNTLNSTVGASDDAATATGDLADEQKDATKRAQEHRKALEDLYDTLLGQIDAEYAYEKASADQGDAVRELDAVLADKNATLIEARDAIFGAKDASLQMAQAFVESKGVTLDSKAGVDLMIESLYNQAVALGPDSPLRQELLDYIAELQKIPSQIDTSIRLSVTGQTVNINPSRYGDVIGVRSLPGVAVRSARGRFVAAGSNLLSTLAEPGAGDEAVLPLQNRGRLTELLGDPRIGGPVADAFGAMGGSRSATNVTTIIEGNIYGDAALRAQLDERDRAFANSIARGRR